MRSHQPRALIAAIAVTALVTPAGHAEDPAPDKLPALDSILDGYERVTPADGGDTSMYTLYHKKDTHDLLAVLPTDHEKQRILLANTLAAGFVISGIQSSSELLYWKRYGNRIALMMPQLETRTSGDLESRRSRETLYPDSVRLDMPIVAEGPNGEPVIDLDALFIDRSVEFHKFSPGALDTKLGSFSSIKVFSDNISLSVQMPWHSPDHWLGGPMMTLTFSMSVLPEDPEYSPREADIRVGYFHVSHKDLARISDDSRRRHIKRWKLEKADPSLSLSPPREPIVFYIDHKTPIRYRRWVREGILAWNEAFAAVGIVDAIEVYQQDARTRAHMEKDPEDVHHNFVVWNSNDVGFAIGPCRVDPRSGRILDADVVFNDGWLRYGVDVYRNYLAEIAMEGMDRETMDWLARRPQWDPRVRLARPAERTAVLADLERSPKRERSAVAATSYDDPTATRYAHDSRCRYGSCRSVDLTLARLSLLDIDAFATNGSADDVPEEFIGAMVRDVIMHEIGHVLGLRHNFKGSTLYTIEQIHSREWLQEGRPISGSVMDYNAIEYDAGEGPRFMTTLGPYDRWAIRYGYADDGELEAILGQATQPANAYLTDEDLYGPDPTARSRDLGRDALEQVDRQMVFVQRLRGMIAERALEDGKSYQRARDAYMTLLFTHWRSLATAVRYVGGVYVRRDLVGSAERKPTEVVPAAEQRRALGQIIRYAFHDEAFGLTPDLLDLMSYDKWMDGKWVPWDLPDPQLDVHDLVLGVQASSLTTLLNPTRMRRIIDNELRLPPDQDAMTLAELLDTISSGIWTELDGPANGTWTARAPYISSLRRNLQREHLERMIDLALTTGMAGATQKPVATLAAFELHKLGKQIEGVLEQTDGSLDVYTLAHLQDTRQRIQQASNAVHVYE